MLCPVISVTLFHWDKTYNGVERDHSILPVSPPCTENYRSLLPQAYIEKTSFYHFKFLFAINSNDVTDYIVCEAMLTRSKTFEVILLRLTLQRFVLRPVICSWTEWTFKVSNDWHQIRSYQDSFPVILYPSAVFPLKHQVNRNYFHRIS